MIKHLIELADYLDSNGKKHYANQVDYAIKKVSQIEQPETSEDAKIEDEIKFLGEFWIDAKLNNETDFGIYDVRNDIYNMLKNHSNPMLLLGDGWSVQEDNGEYVLVNPEGEVSGDEGPEDPIFNVAMYLTRLIEDELYRTDELERAPTEEALTKWDAPDPNAMIEYEKSLDAPNPHTINKEHGRDFEFPEKSRGMHADFDR
jgi:hypothetical protein